MGFTEDIDLDDSSPSLSMTDALLFATMYIVGLPVDVQVKDGSIYSGIFHTASVQSDYGIVLKKARKIKKGCKEANLAHGSVIDTLVVLPGDLVQVIAKGVMIPADGINGNQTGNDVEAIYGLLQPTQCPEPKLNMAKSGKATPEAFASKRHKISQTRSPDQGNSKIYNGLASANTEADSSKNVGKGYIMKELAGNILESVHEVQLMKGDDTVVEEASCVPFVIADEGQVGNNRLQGGKHEPNQNFGSRKVDAIHDAGLPKLKLVNGVHAEIASDETSSCPVPLLGAPDILDCERRTSTDFSSTSTAAPKGPISNTSAKEFKLNPGAKTFSPVFSLSRSVTPPAETVAASITYIPRSPSVVPAVGAHSETGISSITPHSSLPIKFVQYNNLLPVNGGSGSHYNPPIVGHVGSRPLPVRYASQYTPLQAGPTYVSPNSQSVMLGRLGQLLYVHPVSHDVMQGTTTPSVHSLFTPPQAHVHKQQGIPAPQAFQLCVSPPPFTAGSGQPSFTLPVPIPFSQPPLPTVRPIPGPGANAHYVSKFI